MGDDLRRLIRQRNLEGRSAVHHRMPRLFAAPTLARADRRYEISENPGIADALPIARSMTPIGSNSTTTTWKRNTRQRSHTIAAQPAPAIDDFPNRFK
ncbi:hypothetical protein [Prosthecodimorpha staleyi]|uniref:Uncharacterized protein n=1 Tax=Prosthecodimorpha staleyi TaxID=2840188 RepID=A0A947DCQ2_9HYPH|nr:hypothetical protein [Prosthecodimorpha staleyi]MBT9292514.1 hypothetical protein [Prosthecodimorpha staleyi]